MSSITKIEFADQSDQGRRTRRFSRAASKPASPGVVGRQARLTLLAFSSYDARENALAFLNEYSDELGGRPVDIAGSGDTGLAAATSLLHALLAHTATKPDSRTIVRTGRALLLRENYDLGSADS